MSKLELVRFHVQDAPPSLVRRVLFKLAGTRPLKIHGAHFAQRLSERGGRVEDVALFSPELWSLVTIEVRRDNGKFVKTAWERVIDDAHWRVVLGFNDTVLTLIRVNAERPLRPMLPSSRFWSFVECVNADLMAQEPSPG
jgi:hypothetical protein